MVCCQSSDRLPEALTHVRIVSQNPTEEMRCEPWLQLQMAGPLSVRLAASPAVERLGGWAAQLWQTLGALGLSSP